MWNGHGAGRRIVPEVVVGAFDPGDPPARALKIPSTSAEVTSTSYNLQVVKAMLGNVRATAFTGEIATGAHPCGVDRSARTARVVERSIGSSGRSECSAERLIAILALVRRLPEL